MKLLHLLIAALTLPLISCAPSADLGAGTEAENGKQNTNAAKSQSVATSEDPGQANTDVAEESDAWWQLGDDSVFTATLDPWPPKPGVSTLNAEATEDDWEQKFAGTAEYRIAMVKDNDNPWLELPNTGEDEHGTKLFSAPVTLERGSAYIQFRLRDEGDSDFTELLDWQVDLP